MEMRLRSLCCELSTLVTVVCIIQTVVWTVTATLSVAWTVLAQTGDSYPWLAQSQHSHSTVLIICLTASVSGILSNLLVLLGLRTGSRYLLLPGMVFGATVVLALLVTGLYCVVYLTAVTEEKDYVLTVVSSSLILLGIFMIFMTVFVILLFIEMKQKQLLVRVASSFRGSRASVNYKSNNNTTGSVRSNRSRHRQRHHSDQHRTSKSYRVEKFSCQLDLPRRKSQSLEHILNPSNGNYSNHVDTVRNTKSVAIHPHVTQYHYRDTNVGDGLKDVESEDHMEDKEFSKSHDECFVPPPIYPSKEEIIGYNCGDGEFIL